MVSGHELFRITHMRRYTCMVERQALLRDLQSFIATQGFHVKSRGNYSKGTKKGVHVNHIPKFRLSVAPVGGSNYGRVQITFHFFTEMKLVTALEVGVVTEAVSSLFGEGKLAAALFDAQQFVNNFWRYVDVSVSAAGVVILTEQRTPRGAELVVNPYAFPLADRA